MFCTANCTSSSKFKFNSESCKQDCESSPVFVYAETIPGVLTLYLTCQSKYFAKVYAETIPGVLTLYLTCQSKYFAKVYAKISPLC